MLLTGVVKLTEHYDYQAFIHSINLKKAGVGQPKYCNNAYVHVVLTNFCSSNVSIFKVFWSGHDLLRLSVE